MRQVPAQAGDSLYFCLRNWKFNLMVAFCLSQGNELIRSYIHV